ncbi:cyclic nucleotide-binding domain-containing protein [Coraliomargarita akajimensis]|uniref:Putative transcriptional regulator, Crp/Fnr family n=1 Tax=Coraliomargarita akajimensis (strain DSM 45221 / IAM 15411 / JCM 23193 / KCTC 12865 / 04OKA010-24) TaxID=583355 RepID=D5EIV0_CORAD|nr:cyclic nucleotide-binding domain-containing protein [Coraliomargarita akajimensis]ADE54349.1 putative transcriptional regulator, Crp/Fnr family [Coraliomargarita akajimensis DSM 45221]
MPSSSRPTLSAQEIRLASRSGFDLPKPMRIFFLMVGLIGVGLIVMESLSPSRSEMIQLDKLIHFFGYAALSFTFSLTFKPRLLAIALILTLAGSIGIEFLQKLTGRSFDTHDMVANALGILAGTSIGVTGRWFWSIISKQLAEGQAYKRLRVYGKGALIAREGQAVHHLKIVKSGKVEVTRKSWNQPMEFGEGSIIGLMAAIKGEAQMSDIRALDNTVLYEMELDELYKDVGGQDAPVGLVINNMADVIIDLSDKLQKEMST